MTTREEKGENTVMVPVTVRANGRDTQCFYPISSSPTKAEIEKKKETKNASFFKLTFPQTKRIFPSLFASKIVSIQPMSLPTSSLFFVDFSYKKKSPFKTLIKKE